MTNPTTITAEPGVPFIEIRREFDASVSAVFRAHMDPALLAQWMGPREATFEVREWDPAVGGRWRYGGEGGGGFAFEFRGVFHTIRPDALIIQTFEFDGAPDQVGVDTCRFGEEEGRTVLRIHELYPSVEARDAAMASGMDYGITVGYERLDEILAG